MYFDNGASSFPKAPGVGEAMMRYIEANGANVNRGVYAKASSAAMTVLETREQLALLFGFSGDVSHVVFTPGVTYALNQVLKGFLKPGDHCIVSSMEHNAVMRPLQELAALGVEFDRIPADVNGLTDAEAILPLFRENTKLVVVSHASNVCGAIFPLEKVAEICYERNIPLAVDAAQTAGHVSIDFDRLHLSALCVPGHKGLLGPQGIGAMLLEKEFAAKLTPIVTGGTGSASDSEIQPSYMPDKFESGTLNIPGIFGLNAALGFILSHGTDYFRTHEKYLTDRFLEGLRDIPARVVGPSDSDRQVGVVSIDFGDIDNAEASYILESEYGILTRCGLHCAPNAHRTLHTFPQGTVRFSVGYTTTEEEVDAVVQAIKNICAGSQLD